MLFIRGIKGANILGDMHGYFIDFRLYKKVISYFLYAFTFFFFKQICYCMFDMCFQAHAAANPVVYEEYLEKRKKEKDEEERSTRITVSI
uniref:Nucleolar protein 10-like second domain-containing protein n=1 Tax=Lactuca sativa TaxID=4236 RepID=A0A9R1X3R7_LACSA|nr:hypothetical protein LSAT_V11C600317930 [Lactuca sativa]